MSWICNTCETLNEDAAETCEICAGLRTSLLHIPSVPGTVRPEEGRKAARLLQYTWGAPGTLKVPETSWEPVMVDDKRPALIRYIFTRKGGLFLSFAAGSLLLLTTLVAAPEWRTILFGISGLLYSVTFFMITLVRTRAGTETPSGKVVRYEKVSVREKEVAVPPPQSLVICLSFSEDGGHLIVLDNARQLTRWQMKTGKVLGVRNLGKDTRHKYWLTGGTLVTWDVRFSAGTEFTLDTVAHDRVRHFQFLIPTRSPITWLTLSDDQSWFVAGTVAMEVFIAKLESIVKCAGPVKPFSKSFSGGREPVITALAVASSGEVVAAGSSAGEIGLLRTSNMKVIRNLFPEADLQYSVASLALSSDGTRLAFVMASGSLWLADVFSSELPRRVHEGGIPVLIREPSRQLVFLSGDNLIAVPNKSEILLLDYAGAEVVDSRQTTLRSIKWIEYHRDTRQLAVAGAPAAIEVFRFLPQ